MRAEAEATAAAEARAREYRWKAPAEALVVHKKFGRVEVPCRSKLCAIQCAAELWGVDWTEIRDAEVWRV